MAKALVGAINLEQLQLSFAERELPQFEQFEAILGGCRFSKLKSLGLLCLQSTEDQLVGFLGSSPGLETRKLCDHDLTLGLWEHVAHRNKQFLQLQSASLHIFLEWVSRIFWMIEMWTISSCVMAEIPLQIGRLNGRRQSNDRLLL